jgi:hypothetical protein
MPKGSSKRPKREDEAQAAHRILATIIEKTEAREPAEDAPVEITPEMRAAAAAFGRIGGKIGGVRRAEKLTKEQRSEIARQGAAARWKKLK